MSSPTEVHARFPSKIQGAFPHVNFDYKKNPPAVVKLPQQIIVGKFDEVEPVVLLVSDKAAEVSVERGFLAGWKLNEVLPTCQADPNPMNDYTD